MSNNKHSTKIRNDVSKIIGIQFSILSPEEIRKSSVAEITSRDTYMKNKPVINLRHLTHDFSALLRWGY